MTRAVSALHPPPGRHPYYIVAPPYTRFSAGARVLHLLCHALNSVGQTAFLVDKDGCPPGTPFVHPDLLTPRLSAEVVDYHFAAGLTPVTVYPEVVEGNPFSAPLVVRYVLNFPGLLGGDSIYPPSELCYGYSKSLAESAGAPDNILFIPASDTAVFHPPQQPVRRQGSCFYAVKYRSQNVGPLLPRTAGAVEITRDMSQQDMAALFQRSEWLFCYENTAAALEATLCGCPAVFLPNAHLTERIGDDVVGWDGYAWGDGPDELERAARTVGAAWDNYLKSIEGFWSQLDLFIARTQARAVATPYGVVMRVPLPRPGRWRQEGVLWWNAIRYVLRREGVRGLACRVSRRLWSGKRSKESVVGGKAWRSSAEGKRCD